MPEWSKGHDSSSCGFGRVGSNPTRSTFWLALEGRSWPNLSPATLHGCHDLRESMSRARGQQMKELRHIHSKEGVKKTSWSCAELLKFAP